MKWIRNITTNGELSFPLVDSQRRLIVYSHMDSSLISLNPDSGNLVWRNPVGPLKFSPALGISTDILFVHDSVSGYITAFRSSNGETLWRSNSSWVITSDLYCNEIDGKSVLILVSEKRTVIGLDSGTGNVIFSIDSTVGQIQSTVVFNNHIITVSTDGKEDAIITRSIKVDDKSQGWIFDGRIARFPAIGGLKSRPILSLPNKSLILISQTSVVALDISVGGVIWNVQTNANHTFIDSVASETTIFNKHCVGDVQIVSQSDVRSGNPTSEAEIGICTLGGEYSDLIVDKNQTMFTTSYTRAGVHRLLGFEYGARIDSTARAELQVLLRGKAPQLIPAGSSVAQGSIYLISFTKLSPSVSMAFVGLLYS